MSYRYSYTNTHTGLLAGRFEKEGLFAWRYNTWEKHASSEHGMVGVCPVLSYGVLLMMMGGDVPRRFLRLRER